MPKIPEQIATLISVSQTYFEDGALQTAADRLHEAAAMMRRIADERDVACLSDADKEER